MLRYVAQAATRSRGRLDRRQRPRVRRHHPGLREAYAAKTGPCRTEQQAVVDAERKRPSRRGQGDRRGPGRHGRVRLQARQYRFIVQSYGSPVPRAAEARYGELDPQRASVGGCPFYDTDLTGPATRCRADRRRPAFVAAGKGIEYLDLRDPLQGHEVCAAAPARRR